MTTWQAFWFCFAQGAEIERLQRAAGLRAHGEAAVLNTGSTMTPLQTLKMFRAAMPTPMTNDQIGQLLNAVAWAHRTDGLGMLSKPNGANCRQPQTRKLISRDYLVYKDGRGYDVLRDAEGQAIPQWGKQHDMDTDQWVAPVDTDLPDVPDIPDVPDAPTGKPYDEAKAVEFGMLCNDVYRETPANKDAGMIAVFATRAAFDYYVGGMKWEDARRKHVNEFRASYGLDQH